MVERLTIINSGGVKEAGEPQSRRGFNMERVEEKIYVWNGYCSQMDIWGVTQHKDSEEQIMHVYDILKHSWYSIQTSGDVIQAGSGSGVSSVGRNIYTFGGFFQLTFHDTHAVFNTENLTWKRLHSKGNKPCPRDKIAMFSHGKLIYLFGGWSFPIARLQPRAAFHHDVSGWGAGWNNELYKYDTETDIWSYVETVGPLPQPRAASSFIKIDNHRALMFGGRIQDKRMNDVHILDLSTHTWGLVIAPLTPPAPWPSERSLFSAHLVSSPASDNPLVFGFWGMDNNSKVIDDYWLLDCRSMSWTSIGHNVSNLPVPRLWCMSCSFFNTKSMTAEIFAFGGCKGDLTGRGSTRSYDLPGMVHMELGLKKLENLCIEVIADRFEVFKQSVSCMPPKLLRIIYSRLH